MAHARERIQKQILRKINDLLLRDLQDPRIGMITLTRAELARDKSHCTVYWSTLDEGGSRSATLHGLEEARGFIQREVGKILDTRLTPRLEFRFDESVEGVERLSRILREARREDEERAQTRGDGEPGADGDDEA